MVLDADFLTSTLLDFAKKGVENGLELVRDRAKMHAPVRDIFRHPQGKRLRAQSTGELLHRAVATGSMAAWHQAAQGGPPASLSGRALQRAGVPTTAAHGASTLPTHRGQQIIVSEFSGSRAFTGGPNPVTRSPESARRRAASGVRGRVSASETAEKVGGGTVYGRANSYAPVIKSPTGYIGGEELRHWGGPGVLQIEKIRGAGGKSFKLSDLISARGRYEMQSERALTKTTSKTGESQITIGGRLRESIKIEGPFVSGGETYGFVSASAHDPGSSHNYARDQEFGSRHNRASPFLRPGLRESKARVLDLDRGAIARAFHQGARPSSSGNAKSPIVVEVQVTLRGFRTLDRHLDAMFPEEGG
jgi:hypothetical protein